MSEQRCVVCGKVADALPIEVQAGGLRGGYCSWQCVKQWATVLARNERQVQP